MNSSSYPGMIPQMANQHHPNSSFWSARHSSNVHQNYQVQPESKMAEKLVSELQVSIAQTNVTYQRNNGGNVP